MAEIIRNVEIRYKLVPDSDKVTPPKVGPARKAMTEVTKATDAWSASLGRLSEIGRKQTKEADTWAKGLNNVA